MESSSSVSPPLIANPVSSSSSRARESQSRRRKKKMKTQQSQSLSSQNPNPNNNISQPSKISWNSETTRQLYSSKLLQTLRHMRLTSSSSSSSPASPVRGRAVREAADRALAMAARGRTRWSRAILTGRLRLKFMNKKLRRQRARATGDRRSPRKPRVEILKLKGKNLAAVQRKVKTLGRLVPGCRKEPLPVILEEATDYIPALEMQARVLREILALFGSAGAGEGSSSGSSPPENGSV